MLSCDVVRDVLDADELEHVVDVTPVLEHPLRAVDADRGHGTKVSLPEPFAGLAG